MTDRVQPRIGFSWQPYPGTVVRGGYGLFSGLNQGSTYYAMRVENGVVQVNYNYSGCGTSQARRHRPARPFPHYQHSCIPNRALPAHRPVALQRAAPRSAERSDGRRPAGLGTQSFHGLDPNFVPPLAHEAELGVEQALPGKMSLSVGYVGTRALRLPVFLDANLIGQTPHGSRTYNVVDASSNLVKQLTVPVYLTSDRRDSRLQSYNTGFSVANTWYNSMAVSRPPALLPTVLKCWSTTPGPTPATRTRFRAPSAPSTAATPSLDPNNICSRERSLRHRRPQPLRRQLRLQPEAV